MHQIIKIQHKGPQKKKIPVQIIGSRAPPRAKLLGNVPYSWKCEWSHYFTGKVANRKHKVHHLSSQRSYYWQFWWFLWRWGQVVQGHSLPPWTLSRRGPFKPITGSTIKIKSLIKVVILHLNPKNKNGPFLLEPRPDGWIFTLKLQTNRAPLGHNSPLLRLPTLTQQLIWTLMANNPMSGLDRCITPSLLHSL